MSSNCKYNSICTMIFCVFTENRYSNRIIFIILTINIEEPAYAPKCKITSLLIYNCLVNVLSIHCQKNFFTCMYTMCTFGNAKRKQNISI